MHKCFMTINKVDSSGKLLRYDVYEDELEAQARITELHEMGLTDAFYINQADNMYGDVAPSQAARYLDVDIENKTATINQAALNERDFKKAMSNLRQDRNQKLLNSDVAVLPDRGAGMNDDTKANWTDYRQALRDLPETVTDDPTNVTWPEEPVADSTNLS